MTYEDDQDKSERTNIELAHKLRSREIAAEIAQNDRLFIQDLISQFVERGIGLNAAIRRAMKVLAQVDMELEKRG